MRAVILAGGKGTRLRPLTDTRPKPLLPFAGDPFAAGLLRRLRSAGCTHATFLVGADGAPFAPLSDLGEALGVVVDVVTEPKPLDTAGAARDLLRDAGDGPFVVCNGDILTDLDFVALIAAHTHAGATATLALTRVEDTSTFGVVETGPDGAVLRFVEKPPPGTLAADTINAGTYVLEPPAFDGCPPTGPLSFERAVFPGLVEGGATVLGVPNDAFWMDLGTPDRYLRGQHAVLSGQCRWPIGDAFRRDGDALVHRDATVDSDATVATSVIGPRAEVGAGARVQRSALFEGVHVAADAVIHDAIVGEGTTIGRGTVVTGAVAANIRL
jgi:NDP-sugar pyrophosphorylase family protein